MDCHLPPAGSGPLVAPARTVPRDAPAGDDADAELRMIEDVRIYLEARLGRIEPDGAGAGAWERLYRDYDPLILRPGPGLRNAGGRARGRRPGHLACAPHPAARVSAHPARPVPRLAPGLGPPGADQSVAPVGAIPTGQLEPEAGAELVDREADPAAAHERRRVQEVVHATLAELQALVPRGAIRSSTCAGSRAVRCRRSPDA